MRKKAVCGAIVVFLAGVILGLWADRVLPLSVFVGKTAGFVPACRVGGDVAAPFLLTDPDELPKEKFTAKEKRLQGTPLADIVAQAQPVAEVFEVLLLGSDGMAAVLDGSTLAGSYLLFSPANGWEAVNRYHPASSNVKRIAEIIVMAENAPPETGVNIVSQEANLLQLTPGGVYKGSMPVVPYFEGASTASHDGKQYGTSVYTYRRLFPLSALLPPESGKRLLAMGRQGAYADISADGWLELKDNVFHYLPPDREGGIADVAGIVVDPPAASIMDLYPDTEHYLRSGRVMVLYLDGFGYHQYLHAVNTGYAPFLAELPPAVRALTVYQPVTNAGFAAMITGRPPEENGVWSREQMDLLVPSIFALAENSGKKAALIEGNIKILNTEVEPMLNPDVNGDGSTDDEIMARAVACLDQGYDLLFVHFHSIDDAGHTYGDLSPETLRQVQAVDGYVRELVTGWEGTVIILADHGMHNAASAGSHGVFCYEDLFVPYIIAKGGKNG